MNRMHLMTLCFYLVVKSKMLHYSLFYPHFIQSYSQLANRTHYDQWAMTSLIRLITCTRLNDVYLFYDVKYILIVS